MNVLSLFDGMACGRIAIDRMGIIPTKYYASEIDKHCIAEVHANYPDVVQLGDVRSWVWWQIDWKSIDLIIGGSPCQGFSFAGKQLNFDDPRSKLFFDYVDIVNFAKKHNPKVTFLLENVRMKQEFQDIISKYLGSKPVFIDSAIHTAVTRKRLYWSNRKFLPPHRKEANLIDILEDDVFEASGSAIRGRRKTDGIRDDKNKHIKPIQTLELRSDNKANCITSVSKDSLITIRQKSKTLRVGGREDTFGSRRMWDSPFKIMDKKGNQKRNQNKASCLTGGGNSGGNHSDMDLIKSDYETRRYTIRECCRLHGVPDDYFKVSSKTQAYKMIGNGWQVDTIMEILKQII